MHTNIQTLKKTNSEFNAKTFLDFDYLDLRAVGYNEENNQFFKAAVSLTISLVFVAL